MSKGKIKKLDAEAKKRGNEDYIDIKTGDIEFTWCCNCSLRHVVIYDIIRGNKPKNDIVRIRTRCDDFATELKRHFDRRGA